MDQMDVPTPEPTSPLCRGLHGSKIEVERDFKRSRNALVAAACLCFCFMVGEVVGGLYAGSLGVLTDAAHLLSDFAGFMISLVALNLSQRAPTHRLSFGFFRAEILGALTTVLMIWLLSGVLVYTAVQRVLYPTNVDGKLMFIVAAAGFGGNLASMAILFSAGHGHSHGPASGHGHGHDHSHGHSHHSHTEGPSVDQAVHGNGNGNGVGMGEVAGAHHGHSHGGASGHAHGNLNVRAALLHVVGDGIQALGVMIAGALIWYSPSWRIADPLCTFMFVVLTLWTTRNVWRQCIAVLMEAAPETVSIVSVEQKLKQLPGVLSVHDLHIWSLSIGRHSLSVHLFCLPADSSAVLGDARKLLVEAFAIHHSTIQVETDLASHCFSCPNVANPTKLTLPIPVYTLPPTLDMTNEAIELNSPSRLV